ncbi:MAG TPA: peptide chain release factor N(5)-glutamine methyltransferase [Woeseiaceae bacterium]|nr:peptide chain release factor N(5)-glutamine methyltransferase [Woeseiaceae bacterium]
MRLDAAIASATAHLGDVSESARLDAEILLSTSIDMPRSYLFAHPEDELDSLSLERFETLLARRLDGEPIAYITGRREFWSHELQVSPATLVPRPETEVLVDLALQTIPHDANWQILDLGTGSGAIAIAIASERPLCDITATDISADALAIAAGNAREASLGNTSFIEGRWTTPVRDRCFELIVSNPPYVSDDDEALSGLRFEPRSALASGADGLDDIRILASDCAAILTPGGWLMLEHGATQQTEVARLLSESGWVDIACHNDLVGQPRVTVARRNVTQATIKPSETS